MSKKYTLICKYPLATVLPEAAHIHTPCGRTGEKAPNGIKRWVSWVMDWYGRLGMREISKIESSWVISCCRAWANQHAAVSSYHRHAYSHRHWRILVLTCVFIYSVQTSYWYHAHWLTGQAFSWSVSSLVVFSTTMRFGSAGCGRQMAWDICQVTDVCCSFLSTNGTW